MSWPQKSGFWLLKMGSTVVFQFWDKDDKTKRYAWILGAHHGTPFSQANDKNWIFKSFKGRNVPKPNWFKKIPKWTQFPIKRAPVGRPGTAASSMRPGSAQGMFNDPIEMSDLNCFVVSKHPTSYMHAAYAWFVSGQTLQKCYVVGSLFAMVVYDVVCRHILRNISCLITFATGYLHLRWTSCLRWIDVERNTL